MSGVGMPEVAISGYCLKEHGRRGRRGSKDGVPIRDLLCRGRAAKVGPNSRLNRLAPMLVLGPNDAVRRVRRCAARPSMLKHDAADPSKSVHSQRAVTSDLNWPQSRTMLGGSDPCTNCAVNATIASRIHGGRPKTLMPRSFDWSMRAVQPQPQPQPQ